MVILGMSWLACHNPKIDWRIGEVKDKVPRGMWEAVETSAKEVGVGKAEGRRSEGRSRKEERGEG